MKVALNLRIIGKQQPFLRERLSSPCPNMSTLPIEELPHVLFMLLLKIVWEQNISITTQNEGAARVSREATDNEQVINSQGGIFFNVLHLNCRLYKDRVQPSNEG